MSLSQNFLHLLSNYGKAQSEPFTKHPLGKLVREDIREYIEKNLDRNRYKVKGSVGQGNWTTAPWIGIFDILVTESAQSGYYIVYLIREDCSGIYLSLNQGVTNIREQYGSDTKQALRSKAKNFRERLHQLQNGFVFDPITITTSKDTSNPVLYQEGNICSKFYSLDNFPEEQQLLGDLDTALGIYRDLFLREMSSSNREEDEDGVILYEDRTKVRLHKSTERNQTLSRKVKAVKGMICEACGFEYGHKYQNLDTDYIEAHHLTPFSQLEAKKIPMNPKEDFAVLCSNCHRMIHRSNFISDIQLFKKNHLRPNH